MIMNMRKTERSLCDNLHEVIHRLFASSLYVGGLHVYPLNANRLSNVELPLPLKSVQVPELGCVRGRADGVAT